MRLTGPVAPTNPYHIARAYGAERPGPVASPMRPAAPAPLSSARPTTPPLAVSRLVAAVVPGGVSFDPPSADVPGAPAADTGRSLELYRRPADRNTAATGVGLGRVIDVSG